MNATLLSLLELCLKSSGVLLLTFAVMALWRNASASARSVIWCAAFAVLALLPATLFLRSPWAISYSQQFEETKDSKSPSPTEAPHIAAMPDSTAPASDRPSAMAAGTLPASSIVMGLWLAGTGIILAYRVLGSWQLRRFANMTDALPEGRETRLVHEIAREMKIRRRLKLRVGKHVAVPVTWGTLWPVIALPYDAVVWDGVRLAAALRHEMGHIRHGDAITRLFGSMVSALYWPSFLVWPALKAWRTAQEQACDDLVVRSGAGPEAYAMQLLEAAQLAKGCQWGYVPVLAMARASTLEKRLQGIMDTDRRREPAGLRMLAGSALAALFVAFGCTNLQVRAADPPAKSGDATALPLIRISTRFIEPPAGLTISPLRDNATLIPLSEQETQELIKQLDVLKVEQVLPPDLASHPGQKGIVEVLPAAGDSGRSMSVEVVPTLPGNGMVELELHFRFEEESDPRQQKTATKASFRTSVQPGESVLVQVSPHSKAASGTSTPVLCLTTVHKVGVAAKDSPSSHKTYLYRIRTVKREGAGQPATQQKAEAFIVPNVSFQGATLAEVIAFMQAKSRELDPLKEGLKILLKHRADPPEKISMELINIPLAELIKYVAELGGCDVIYTQEAVLIQPKSDSGSSSLADPPARPVAGPPSAVKLRADSIILPSVSLNEIPLEEAVDFLRTKSRELDPKKEGLDIVLSAPKERHPTITLKLSSVPLSEALGYLSSLASLPLTYTDRAVLIGR